MGYYTSQGTKVGAGLHKSASSAANCSEADSPFFSVRQNSLGKDSDCHLGVETRPLCKDVLQTLPRLRLVP